MTEFGLNHRVFRSDGNGWSDMETRYEAMVEKNMVENSSKKPGSSDLQVEKVQKKKIQGQGQKAQ